MKKSRVPDKKSYNSFLMKWIRQFHRFVLTSPARVTLMAFVLLAALGMLADLRLQDVYNHSAGEKAEMLLFPLRDEVSSALRDQLVALAALRMYVEMDLSPAQLNERFQTFAARQYQEKSSVLRFVLLRSGGSEVRYPPEAASDRSKGQVLPDFAYSKLPAQTGPRQVVLANPVTLASGRLVLVAYEPIYLDGVYWGLVGQINDLSLMLENTSLGTPTKDFQVALRDTRSNVFWGTPLAFTDGESILPIGVPQGHWDIAAHLDGGWTLINPPPLIIGRILGLVVIVLFCLGIYKLTVRQVHLNQALTDRTSQVESELQVRLRAEAQLQRSQAVMMAIIQSTFTSVVIFDRNFKVLLANPISNQRVLTFRDKQLQVGRSVLDIFDEQEIPEMTTRFNRALAGESVRFERFFDRGPQGKTWFEVTVQPVQLANGEVIGACYSAVDSSEHKMIEENLRQSEQRFSEIFRANPVPLGIISVENYTMLEINRSTEELVGFSSAEIVGRPLPQLPIWVDPQDIPAVMSRLDFNSGIQSFQVPVYDRVKTIHQLMISFVPMELAGERCILAMALDITERILIEREREQLLGQVQAGRERLQELTRQLVGIQEEERRRLSRELHDEAGQALTALSINLEMLASDLPDDLLELRQRMATAVQLTNTTLDQIRSMAQVLRPPALDTLGLRPSLEGLCQSFQRNTRIMVTAHFEEWPGALPDTYNITLYRCLQEALTNVARHARAEHVWAEMRIEPDGLTLIVEDNGRGMTYTGALGRSSRQKLGLVGLQERLELLGGKLEIDSKPGSGTRLTARLPAPQDVHEEEEVT